MKLESICQNFATRDKKPAPMEDAGRFVIISRNHVFLRLFFNRLNEVVIAFSESIGIWLVPSLASLGVTSILRAINRFDWTISRG